MRGLQVLLFITIFALAIRFTAKFLLVLIERFESKQRLKHNPYIKYHKAKNKNDEDYQDYLKWMEREGNGVPVDKVVTPEDKKAERKYRRLLFL